MALLMKPFFVKVDCINIGCLPLDTTSISISAGCDLFMRHVAKTSALDYKDFSTINLSLVERCKVLGEIYLKAHTKIAMLSQNFISDGCTILVHGYSRAVLEVLKTAIANKKFFRVLCTDGLPDSTGLMFSIELTKLGIPVKLVINSAGCYIMGEFDMIPLGANGIIQSGGIINMIGTYQIAVVVHIMNKPVYVAAESYKPLDTTSISISASCDLFVRHVAKTSALDYKDFNSVNLSLVERCKVLGEIYLKARTKIAMLSQDYISDGCTILVHGYSRVVLEVLKTAAANKKFFRVLCADGLPDRTGLSFLAELTKIGIPMKLVIDSAVGYIMDEVDMILVGADGIVQSRGIISMIGTYSIAVVAHSMDKPVYVAVESYKVLPSNVLELQWGKSFH